MVVMAKNPEIKENNKIKENKEEKDSKDDTDIESKIKYCPTNATLADLLTKLLTKANKSIIGQQECVGAKLYCYNVVQPGLIRIQKKDGLSVR
jgi:hypothetical protein